MLVIPNIDAQFNNLYRIVGRMLATIIVQGGESPAMFTKSVVDYIVTGDLHKVTCTIDDIPDAEIRTTVQQASCSIHLVLVENQYYHSRQHWWLIGLNILT